MGRNKYPQVALEEIEPGDVQKMVTTLKELHDMGKPKKDEEVAERINMYFEFCKNTSLRPGVEGLCMALHISRTTLFRWNNGDDCSLYRQELIQSAKSFIGAFLEQAMLSGKISPPSGIFLAKYWLGYKDAISLEDAAPVTEVKKVLTVKEIKEQLLHGTDEI